MVREGMKDGSREFCLAFPRTVFPIAWVVKNAGGVTILPVVVVRQSAFSPMAIEPRESLVPLTPIFEFGEVKTDSLVHVHKNQWL